MCVIIASSGRKYRPDLDTLDACAKQNPDGSGLAWVQDGEVHYLKGLSPAGIADSLSTLSGPVIVHFRIATVGGKRAELCHPFPIAPRPAAKRYGRARSVLFHNGTWSAWREFADVQELDLQGPVSDSRVAAAAVHHHGFHWLRQIPSRFAMLSVRDGIKLLGDWRQIDGLWFSNDYWIPRTQRTLDCELFN